MKKIIIGIVLSAIFVVGCTNNWDEFYNSGAEESSTATLNIMEMLKSGENYSKFVALLELTGLDKELIKDQMFTVWVPINDSVPDLDPDQRERFVRNHINHTALYKSKLNWGKKIKMIAGKNLFIYDNDDYMTIDDMPITKMNQLCTNGVVHEITGNLSPRNNILEFLLEAGDDYSMFRDTLLSHSDTIFDPSASFPLGVDELGNTIYDSVFKITNGLLDRANINSEDEDYTLFLPTNEAIQGAYTELKTYIEGSGRAFTYRDSSNLLSWILDVTSYKQKVEQFTKAGTLTSASGREWRTTYQQTDEEYLSIDTVYQSFSNGYVYKLNKYYLPKYLYLSKVEVVPAYIYDLPADQQSAYYKLENNGNRDLDRNRVDGEKRWLWIQDANNGVNVEFTTVTKDGNGNTIDAMIAPGKYRVTWHARAYNSGWCKMWFNSEEVGRFHPNNFDGKDAVLFENFEVKQEWGFNTMKIKIQDDDNRRRITFWRFIFTPSEDNY